MQIESVSFKNFKVLRDTTLPLSRMTLLVGANGSGKSTALQGLGLLRDGAHALLQVRKEDWSPIGRTTDEVEICANWSTPVQGSTSRLIVGPNQGIAHTLSGGAGWPKSPVAILSGIRAFSLEARALAYELELAPSAELSPNGTGLAVVLDRLRDQHPERFERLNEELRCWFPEFDYILFETPRPGHRAIALRMTDRSGKVPAARVSEGTMLAFGLLTLAHLPSPPAVVCIEEPDRGLHPRMLRNIHEALTRLAHPETSGDIRPPVQVIATTHSPYFLDLFKEHPQEVVIAERQNGSATFRRLTDQPDWAAIIEDSSLGDVWFTGVLGGVPTKQ